METIQFMFMKIYQKQFLYEDDHISVEYLSFCRNLLSCNEFNLIIFFYFFYVICGKNPTPEKCALDIFKYKETENDKKFHVFSAQVILNYLTIFQNNSMIVWYICNTNPNFEQHLKNMYGNNSFAQKIANSMKYIYL